MLLHILCHEVTLYILGGILCASNKIITDGAVLYMGFNNTFSSKFCGAKAIEYACAITHKIAFVFPDEDITEILFANEQLIKRVFKKVIDLQSKILLLVIFQNSNIQSSNYADLETIANNAILDIWNDTAIGSAMDVEKVLRSFYLF